MCRECCRRREIFAWSGNGEAIGAAAGAETKVMCAGGAEESDGAAAGAGESNGGTGVVEKKAMERWQERKRK